jgi:SsrA-binding protein
MLSNINIKNRKAYHLYEILDKYTAGIQLYGTEIKAIREGKASLNDAFCLFTGNELWVKMHISEYAFGTFNNHDPKRDRKLLLNKKELVKLKKAASVKGFSIVPLSLFISDNGYAKLQIALARGKKLFDKREDMKQKDSKREMDRLKKV